MDELSPYPESRIVRVGTDEHRATVAVVLLHGRGQSVADSITISRRLAMPTAAYHALEATDGTWYPQSFLAPVIQNQPFLGLALGTIEAQVRGLEAQGWLRERIVLMGFSQGACLACDYVYRHPARWGGLVAFTGGLIGPIGMRWHPLPELAGTPVLLTNGDADPWVPWQRTIETAGAFDACGAQVQVRKYPGRKHLILAAEIDEARDLLERVKRP